MALEIGIKVDTSQVKEAKSQIDLLNKTKNEAGSKVDRSSIDKVTGGAAAYRKEMESVHRTVSATSKEFDKIVNSVNSMRSAGGIITQSAEAARRQKEAMQEANRYWSQMDQRTPSAPRKTAAQQYYEQHGNYGRTVPGDGSDGGGAGRGSDFSGIKKALGWTLAAAGGFSLLGFLAQSRAKYQQSVGYSTTLEARGITGGIGAGIGLGVGPLEYMQLAEQVSQSAGMGGGRGTSATRMSAAFGRAYGVDPSLAAGAYGTMYQASGNANLGTAALMTMEQAVKKGMDKARMSELMGMVARNTNVSAQAMGGAGINASQAGTATSLASLIMGLKDGTSYKQYGKSSEFMNLAQNGFQGAGTAPGEVLLFKALGGFKGEMNWEKIYDMEAMKEKGPLSNPAAFSEILSDIKGSNKSRAAQLKKFFPEWNLTTSSAMNIIQMDKDGILQRAAKSGKTFEQLKDGSKGERAMAARLEATFGGFKDAGKMSLQAQKEMEMVKTGDKLNEAFGKLEKAALKAADAIISSKLFNMGVNSLGSMGDWALNNPGMAGGMVGGVVGLGGLWKMKKWLTPAAGASATGEIAAADGAAATGGFLSKIGGLLGATGRFLGPAGATIGGAYGAYKDWKRHTKTWRGLNASSMIAEAAKKYKLDPYFLMSIADVESGFDPSAVSSKGATGIMQIMPSNWKHLGLNRSNVFDPKTNTFAGAHLLSDLQKRYPNASPAKILAMYNMGEGNYAKYGIKKLPMETRNYLVKVDDAYHGYTGGPGGIGGKNLVQFEPTGEGGGESSTANEIAGALYGPLSAMLQCLIQIAANTSKSMHSATAPAPNR